MRTLQHGYIKNLNGFNFVECQWNYFNPPQVAWAKIITNFWVKSKNIFIPTNINSVLLLFYFGKDQPVIRVT